MSYFLNQQILLCARNQVLMSKFRFCIIFALVKSTVCFSDKQIRVGLEESLHYRILSNSSFDVCVCSSEAKSVRFSIIPKKLGQMPLKVVAKDVATSACEVGAQQMTLGVTDAVIRKLLVEVWWIHRHGHVLP